MTDHTPARLRELLAKYFVADSDHELATALRAAADQQERDARFRQAAIDVGALIVRTDPDDEHWANVKALRAALAAREALLKRAMEQLLIEDIAQQGLGFESPDARTLAAEIAALLGDDDAPAS